MKSPKIRKNFNDTALLIIDVQDIFCNPARPAGTDRTATIAGKIADTVQQFRDAGVAIYALFLRNASQPGIDPYLYIPADSDTVIRKTGESAFEATGIEKVLKDAGVKKIVTCGMYLSACVAATAQDALERGFETTVAGDLVADGDLGFRFSPRPIIHNMKSKGIRFQNSKRILEQLKNR